MGAVWRLHAAALACCLALCAAICWIITVGAALQSLLLLHAYQNALQSLLMLGDAAFMQHAHFLAGHEQWLALDAWCKRPAATKLQ
jgi:hypothetical protein